VMVDGHQMHINCTGEGGPTVVMDAGLGGWSLDWSAVQPEIAKFTRVCSYDRAGLGWSEPGAAPGDAQHAVADLHSLLANSGEPGPVVLVGHSNGGLRVALYAHAYPREVVGVVLVGMRGLGAGLAATPHPCWWRRRGAGRIAGRCLDELREV
jgi:pimeloyl-ACP methyl ester carboxylesterase